MVTTGRNRRLQVIGGLAFIVLGIGLALAAVVAHLAWALPLRELPLRSGMVDGEVLLAIGVALVLLGRRPRTRAVRRPASLGMAAGSAPSRA
jgi:hypothetical protein